MILLLKILVVIFVIAITVMYWAKYKIFQIVDQFALDSLNLVYNHEIGFNDFGISSDPSPEKIETIREINEVAEELQNVGPWYKAKYVPRSFEDTMNARYPKLCKALKKRGYGYGL